MGTINESAIWHDRIYALDEDDPVKGGETIWSGDQPIDGFSNAPLQQLADRTKWLRENNFQINSRQTFKADDDYTPGVTTSLELDVEVIDPNSIEVFFDGAFQQSTEYSVSGTTVTFNEAIPEFVLQVEIIKPIPIAMSADTAEMRDLIEQAQDAVDMAEATVDEVEAAVLLAQGYATDAQNSASDAEDSADTALATLPIQSATPPLSPLPGVDWIDTSTGRRYTNVGTTEEPVWAEIMASLVVDNATLVDSLKEDLGTPETNKGAEMIAYAQKSSMAIPRNVSEKISETVSVKDFGAIGDGLSHPLSEFFDTLSDAQVKYPHATSLDDEMDWIAFMAAVAYGRANGGARILVPGPQSVYVIGKNQIHFGTSPINIHLDGEGGVLRFDREGMDRNLIGATNPDGIVLRNFKIEGGQLGLNGGAAATGGHGISFGRPKNCVAENLSFVDTRGFSILWFHSGDDVDVPLYSNNFIINCKTDGAGLATAGFHFAGLANSYMINPFAKDTTNDFGTGYTFNIKNNCINCHIVNFMAVDCDMAVAFTDDRSGTPVGGGAKYCRVSGTAIRCGTAVLTNATDAAYIDITAIECGLERDGTPTQGVVIAGGYCNYSVFDLILRGTPSSANNIYSRSDRQIFNLKSWDDSGWLYNALVGTDYNEINVFGGPNRNTNSYNINNKITAAANSEYPFVRDLRNVTNPIWDTGTSGWMSALYAPMPDGSSRTTHGLQFYSNGNVNIRANGSPRMRYLAAQATWVIPDGVPEFTDDTAAAAGGLAVGSIYRTGSTLKIRVA